jgi:4-hydroxyphenylpyruvate dioxygenase-like putative hemolysin
MSLKRGFVNNNKIMSEVMITLYQEGSIIIIIICQNCNSKPAEIFQATGDYCTECWQAITHTNV